MRLRPPPVKLFPLTSKDVWVSNGLPLNVNGLNYSPMAMYERLLSTCQLVAFQETKFVKQDSIQTNEHFIFATDSGAQCFWSDTTSPVFNNRHCVGLVLSSPSHFQDVQDLTSSVCTLQLKNRYLLLRAKLGDGPFCIHVIYAPDEPSERGDFFSIVTDRV